MYKGVELFPIMRYKSIQYELKTQIKHRLDVLQSYCQSIQRIIAEESVDGNADGNMSHIMF